MVVVDRPAAAATPFRSPPKVLIAGAGVGGLTLALMPLTQDVLQQAAATQHMGMH